MGAKTLPALVFTLVFALVLGLPLWCQDDQVVTQTLRWNPVEGALAYEVKVWNLTGVVVQKRVESPTVVLQLRPGEYLYSVTVFNVLDQPEVETPPRPLVVLKAEVPQPEALVPGQMDAVDPVRRLVLRGNLLVEGASVTLVSREGARVVPAHVVGRAEGQWVLDLPVDLPAGAYDLVVENPGGLRKTLREALRVNAERPFDLRVAGGWMGGLPVFDTWFLDVWGADFVNLGFAGRSDVVFLKRPRFQVGAGLDARYWVQGQDLENTSLATSYLSVGLEVFSTFILSRDLRASLRVGGGLTDSRHEFTYENSEGLAWESVDPYASVEVNGSYWFSRWFYLEAGIDLTIGLNNGFTAGLLRPVVLTGVNY